MLKVLKFGGSSMADAKQFEKVKSIVQADPSRKVVVVSAAGKRFSDDHKLTDLLYLCHAHLKYGVACDSVFDMIRSRYMEIRDELGLKTDLESEFDALRKKMDKGISQDELVSRGEYFAARLMADYLGYDFLDSELWLRFKLDGTVDQEVSYEALSRAASGRRVVIPGFYGAMPDGSIKTFTRGGSDITGALAAAALDADVYENWTDVSGFLMADPRIVKDPLPIERITYSELRELSYIGAQVLHEGTIFPVREKNIPLNIRNTNQPDHPGTMIRESFDEPEEKADSSFITGIAGRKNFSVITITKNGMSNEVGVLRRVLEILEKYQLVVEYLPSGIDSVSLVVAADKLRPCQYQILGEIQKALKPDTIHVTEDMAIVAAVGRKMAFKPGISGKIFAALGENGINIRMITQGPEELNIIVGVDNKDFAGAIRVLYDSFVK
ncbi:MAG: aspartate kinase [Clostridiales bacterium]|nr:aspartate kinase [Clostridiales bacterium]MCI6613394.1 aspartate kinase [Clostridiales bacterium]